MAVNKLDITMMEDVGTSASQLLQRDGSGNIPAVDGSQVTGVDTGFTTSTSDPAIDTNPSGGVGSLWYNKTGGEMYVCTDATAGENVWTNIGEGTGNIKAWGGQTYGYTAGGSNAVTGEINPIDRFSFTSDGNASDVGDLVVARHNCAGHQSATYGYHFGGWGPGYSNVIEKVSFATATANATDVGNLTTIPHGPTGSSSTTYGYCQGGKTAAPTWVDIIDKVSYSTDGDATDVGNLTLERQQGAGQSSMTHGYMSGGNRNHPTPYDRIDKHSFSTDGNATDVGNLLANNDNLAGQSSNTHGYTAGGGLDNTGVNVIQKFSFSSDGNSTDVGDTVHTRYGQCGQSSMTYGYVSGGSVALPTPLNYIDKFSFSTDGNSTDVGDLSVSRLQSAGFHV